MASEPDTRSLVLPPRDFWDIYALEELETFERRPGSGYHATAVFDEAGQPGAIFGDEIRLRVEEKDLRAFEYDRHPLFQLGCQPTLAAALRALLRLPLMAEDAIPHRAQLGLIRRLLGASAGQPAPGLYDVLLRDVRKQLESASLSIESALTTLAELRPNEEDFEGYEQTGRVDLLHAEREIVFKAFAFCPTDPAITRELIAVIDNHPFEDAITVQTALWALGRHNDKTAIEYLIPLLDNDDFAFHVITIQGALQFLCSGPELIPLPDEAGARYWQKIVEKLPTTAEAWARYDARSMFWEKRQRVAMMAGLPSDLAQPLRKDEVPAVSGNVAAG